MTAESGRQVLRLAVQEFMRVAVPSRTQEAQFADLFSGLYPRATTSERLACNTMLADRTTLPDTVVALIVTDHAAVNSAFLRRARSLDNNELLLLFVEAMGIEPARIVARRRGLSPSVQRILRAKGDLQINRSLDLRQVDTRRGGRALADARFDTLLQACERRDLTSICRMLSRQLSISEKSAFILLADKRSANLVVGLKFIGMNAPDAWIIYSLLAPGLANKAGMRDDFNSTYAAYSHAQCADIVTGWVRDDLLDQAFKPVPANDSGHDQDLESRQTA